PAAGLGDAAGAAAGDGAAHGGGVGEDADDARGGAVEIDGVLEFQRGSCAGAVEQEGERIEGCGAAPGDGGPGSVSVAAEVDDDRRGEGGEPAVAAGGLHLAGAGAQGAAEGGDGTFEDAAGAGESVRVGRDAVA